MVSSSTMPAPSIVRGYSGSDARSIAPTMRTTTGQSIGGKTLKKKKSAFGWLKKAFSLDEEERAAFEARRLQAAQGGVDPYHRDLPPAPKFLDGKRIR